MKRDKLNNMDNNTKQFIALCTEYREDIALFLSSREEVMVLLRDNKLGVNLLKDISGTYIKLHFDTNKVMRDITKGEEPLWKRKKQ